MSSSLTHLTNNESFIKQNILEIDKILQHKLNILKQFAFIMFWSTVMYKRSTEIMHDNLCSKPYEKTSDKFPYWELSYHPNEFQCPTDQDLA